MTLEELNKLAEDYHLTRTKLDGAQIRFDKAKLAWKVAISTEYELQDAYYKQYLGD